MEIQSQVWGLLGANGSMMARYPIAMPPHLQGLADTPTNTASRTGFRRTSQNASGQLERLNATTAASYLDAVGSYRIVLDIQLVEAPGIEPGSENRSTTATTCVVRR